MNTVTDDDILKHQKLVRSVINREFTNRHIYKRVYGFAYDDLFQIGCIGLFKALQGFDEDKGYKFSTYAYKCIYGEIVNSLRNSYHGTKVRVKITQAIAAYTREMSNKDFNVDSLKEKYNLTDNDLQEVIELSKVQFLCGDKKVKKYQKESPTVFDLCVKHKDFSDNMVQREELEEMLEVLSPAEKEVIDLQLQDLTPTEISVLLGKNRSVVNTLIGKAKKQIRKYYTYDYAM
ncbi:hypothetical protein COE51_01595 [Bacillus pseudomycoides]|nr:hypothetical protein COE51_01595 [Bacillus pseudomycoides]